MTKEAINAVDEVQVKYNRRTRAEERAKIQSSEESAKCVAEKMQNRSYQETFSAMYLNKANRVLNWKEISRGGAAGTVVDLKHIFVVGIRLNASSIVLCHNHPSGNMKPSEADVKITRKIVESGKMLEMIIHDHIILGGESDVTHYSFADEGII